MDRVPGLAAMFVSHSKVRIAPSEAGAALEGLLVPAWERARARWPAVALPAEPFVKHVAERLPHDARDSIESLLAERSLVELYLACACLQGLPSALQTFEREYLARLPALLRNPKHSDATIEDACQQTRMKLLVATPEGGPKLAAYTGRGALLSWVRVIAGRILHKPQAGVEPGVLDPDPGDIAGKLIAPGRPPDWELIWMHHRAAFLQALGKAFATLSSDERHLLRLYVTDQLSMDDLAELFRVNQATISRRLKDVRQRIYKETRRDLQARLGLSPTEFTSFVRVLKSRFDFSLSQLMREEDAPPRPPERD